MKVKCLLKLMCSWQITWEHDVRYWVRSLLFLKQIPQYKYGSFNDISSIPIAIKQVSLYQSSLGCWLLRTQGRQIRCRVQVGSFRHGLRFAFALRGSNYSIQIHVQISLQRMFTRRSVTVGVIANGSTVTTIAIAVTVTNHAYKIVSI